MRPALWWTFAAIILLAIGEVTSGGSLTWWGVGGIVCVVVALVLNRDTIDFDAFPWLERPRKRKAKRNDREAGGD